MRKDLKMRAGKIASQCARKLNFGTLVEAFLFPQFLFFFYLSSKCRLLCFAQIELIFV